MVVSQMVEVICNISARFNSLFDQQVVLCAHEALRNEPFCEPTFWKPSMLHEASSRHQQLTTMLSHEQLGNGFR